MILILQQQLFKLKHLNETLTRSANLNRHVHVQCLKFFTPEEIKKNVKLAYKSLRYEIKKEK